MLGIDCTISAAASPAGFSEGFLQIPQTAEEVNVMIQLVRIGLISLQVRLVYMNTHAKTQILSSGMLVFDTQFYLMDKATARRQKIMASLEFSMATCPWCELYEYAL